MLRFLALVAALALTGGLRPPLARAGDSAKAKSVIFLWLAGGVTHHESFDPKPDAPEEIRGTLSTIQTTLPGVRFAEVMPQMAKQTDKIALVRTFAPGTDDHFQAQAMALSGRMVNLQQIDTEPNVGAVVSKLRGPRAGFPGYIAVPGTTRPGPPPKNLFVGGWLGRQYGPFLTGGKAKNEDFTAGVKEDVGEEEFTKQAVRPGAGLDNTRLDGRRSLREKLDNALKHSEPASAVADEFRGAFDMLLSPTAPLPAFAAELPGPTNDPATPFEHIAFTLPFNMSEQPAASINCGSTTSGLPIGLQIIGQRFDDLGVLQLARAWEQMRAPQRPWPTPPAAR